MNRNIDDATALKTANEIVKTVNANWERLAKQYGLSRNSIEYMRPAFGLKQKT